MKQFTISILLLGISFCSKAQNPTSLLTNLLYQPKAYTTQYMHKDLLMYLTDGWTVEIRNLNWDNYERYTSIKDTSKSFINIRNEKWSSVNKKWETQYMQRYLKTFANNKISVLDRFYYNKDNNSSDTSHSRIVYNYSQSGNLNSVEFWHDLLGPLEKYSKRVFIYNASWKVFLDSTVNLYTYPQYVYSFEKNQYDSNDNLVETIIYDRQFKPLGSKFDTSGIIKYHHDAYNRLTNSSVFAKDQSSISYKKRLESSTTYNKWGMAKELTNYHYESSLDSVIANYRYNQHYDSNGRLQSITSKFNEGSRWRLLDSVALEYTAGGSFDTSYVYEGQLVGISSQRWEWRMRYRYIFDKTSALSTNEISATVKKFSLYPNPSKDLLNIEVEIKVQPKEIKVEIIDMLGKQQFLKSFLVKESVLQTQINIAHLPSGIYFVKVGNTAKKLIKE